MSFPAWLTVSEYLNVILPSGSGTTLDNLTVPPTPTSPDCEYSSSQETCSDPEHHQATPSQDPVFSCSQQYMLEYILSSDPPQQPPQSFIVQQPPIQIITGCPINICMMMPSQNSPQVVETSEVPEPISPPSHTQPPSPHFVHEPLSPESAPPTPPYSPLPTPPSVYAYSLSPCPSPPSSPSPPPSPVQARRRNHVPARSTGPARRRGRRPTDHSGDFQRAVQTLIHKTSSNMLWHQFRRLGRCDVARAPCVKGYMTFCDRMGGEFAELRKRREFQGLGTRTDCHCPTPRSYDDWSLRNLA